MIEEHKENLRPRPVAGGAAAPSAPLVPAAMSKSKAFMMQDVSHFSLNKFALCDIQLFGLDFYFTSIS